MIVGVCLSELAALIASWNAEAILGTNLHAPTFFHHRRRYVNIFAFNSSKSIHRMFHSIFALDMAPVSEILSACFNWRSSAPSTNDCEIQYRRLFEWLVWHSTNSFSMERKCLESYHIGVDCLECRLDFTQCISTRIYQWYATRVRVKFVKDETTYF
jgi:hypothetical protein